VILFSLKFENYFTFLGFFCVYGIEMSIFLLVFFGYAWELEMFSPLMSVLCIQLFFFSKWKLILSCSCLGQFAFLLRLRNEAAEVKYRLSRMPVHIFLS